MECVKLVSVSENIIKFIHGTWESLSTLKFVICMISLSSMLRKIKAGYIIDKVKINHVLFMTNLKLFSKNEKEINSLVSAVQVISKDTSMEFRI